ncbi:MAG: glycosyltransferase 87 family protein [Verrucomicrobiia bacterium]
MQLRDADKTNIADRRLNWLLHPGAWFWLAMALGAAIRFYLVVFTQGTQDVIIWQQHAAGVRDLGLIGYYHSDVSMNHPPFIAVMASLLLRLADTTGIPFRILLRAPFALLDGGTALLLCLLWPKPWRFVVAACYWLNPLSLIFSAYHGNTDSAVAFSVLLCVWLLSRGKTIAAGAALGMGFWIKLPGELAIPALIFFIPGWRKRLIFLFATGMTALLTYLPALTQDAGIVHANVFGYRGQMLQTTTEMPVWGLRVLIASFLPAPDEWPASGIHLANFILQHSWLIALLLLLLLAWLRRSCRSASEVCATIAASYTIIYGLTDNWAFQYFAWSVPFWFFVRPRFLVPAMILAGGYIYSLYWFLCGNPWLLGKWDFIGQPAWPEMVMEFRDLAMLFFFASAWAFLISALREQIVTGFKPPNAGGPGNPAPASKRN